MYRSGPRTDPWGTQRSRKRCVDQWSLTRTNCVRDVRYDSNHAVAVPFTPKRSRNLDNSIDWSTVSKAAHKSNKRSITDSLVSIAHRMSFWTLTKAVSVEWKFLYADWNVSSKWCAMTWSVSCMATALSTSFDTTFKFEIGRKFWNCLKLFSWCNCLLCWKAGPRSISFL